MREEMTQIRRGAASDSTLGCSRGGRQAGRQPALGRPGTAWNMNWTRRIPQGRVETCDQRRGWAN